MKNQALFSSKDKSKKLKCRLQQFLFFRFKMNSSNFSYIILDRNRKLHHEIFVRLYKARGLSSRTGGQTMVYLLHT